MPPNDALEASLLRAHANHDGAALVALYCEAAAQVTDEAQTAFFLTQAYIFALEVADPAAAKIKEQLISLKREQP